MLRSSIRFALTCLAGLGCQTDPEGSASAAKPEPVEPGTDADEAAPDDTARPGAGDSGSLEVVYTVQAAVDGAGTISPEGAVEVLSGQALTFDLAAAEGHALASVSGTCGGTLDGLQFTTAAVEADCTVVAVFDEVVAEPAAYCSGISADDVDVVVCDPELNLDDWSAGRSYWTTDLRIPSGHVLAMPFTANAEGRWGIVEITNNMPGLNASGMHWHGWFSVVPGGEQVEESIYCGAYSPNPNPLQLKWNQIALADWECFLGAAERTLYFNMEVRCFEDRSDVCTPGERYPDDYWVGVWARPVDDFHRPQ